MKDALVKLMKGSKYMEIIKMISSCNTIKFLQKTTDNLVLETAFIKENDRNIICFASMLGCPIKCKICYNGVFPNYYRVLTDNEIVIQCENVINKINLNKDKKKILFSCMGVGEPLLNYENVYKAFLKLNEKYPNNLFALATTGIKPELIKKLAIDFNELSNFKLTISLHSADPLIRKNIIPVNISLLEIKNSVELYKKKSIHEFEWNYVLLKNVNDNIESAEKLINFIDKSDFIKISEFNEVTNSEFFPSENFDEFISFLTENGIKYKIFKSSGKNINIGCGQMVTHYNNLI